MKVLHINCDYMGSNSVHRVMINNISKFDIDNYIFVPTYKKNIFSENTNVDIVRCFNKNDRFFYFYKQKKILTTIIKQYNFSIIDCMHSYTLFTDGNIAYNLNKKYKIPYIVAIRDTDINVFLKYKKYLKPLARNIIKNASRVLFLSHSYKNKISKLLYSDKYPFDEKTVIIPNGVDDFWLNNIYSNKSIAKKDNKLNIVYVGKINKRKNIILTQKSLKKLRKSGMDISFTIAGDIDDIKVFKSIMKYNNTNYVGKMNKNELLELYRKNDIFIMPSHTETFGITYVEAMSQGLPVIYTKKQGFDQQFDEGIVGYHVDDKKTADVVDSINKILLNYESISNNCIEKCKVFKWELICKKYFKIYKEIIKNKKVKE